MTSSARFPRRAVSSPSVASLPLPKTIRVGKKKLKFSIRVLVDRDAHSRRAPGLLQSLTRAWLSPDDGGLDRVLFKEIEITRSTQ